MVVACSSLSAKYVIADGRCQVPVTKKYFPDIPVYVIGNIVEEAKKQAFPGKVKKQYIISCVGSVSHRKNQELLVEDFSKVSNQFPDWNVEIIGGVKIPTMVSL